MRYRLAPACFSALVAGFAAVVLAVPAAHAFTMEGKSVEDQYGVPKFDLEEQAKGFSKGPSSTGSKGQFETPFGDGKLQFGVQQSPSSFGWGGLGFGPSNGTRASRNDFERMVTPESLR